MLFLILQNKIRKKHLFQNNILTPKTAKDLLQNNFLKNY